MEKLKFIIAKVLKKVLQLPAIRDSNIHKTSRVCSGSHIVKSNINKYSYIGNQCSVIYTEIGRFSSIADNCYIGGATHPIEWGSTSPVFHEGRNIMNKNFSNHTFKTSKITKIGNDVWIGSNSLIKSGVIIGDGAIIGMGSVVTKDVEPYTIVGGNPAKVIRKRFDNKVIERLLEMKWWEWEDSKIEIYAEKINNIEKFINYNE